MRITVLALAYLTALLFTPSVALAQANSGACYTVGSPDARAYCLARAHRDPGRCYSIQDAEMRASCLAEVRR